MKRSGVERRASPAELGRGRGAKPGQKPKDVAPSAVGRKRGGKESVLVGPDQFSTSLWCGTKFEGQWQLANQH